MKTLKSNSNKFNRSDPRCIYTLKNRSHESHYFNFHIFYSLELMSGIDNKLEDLSYYTSNCIDYSSYTFNDDDDTIKKEGFIADIPLSFTDIVNYIGYNNICFTIDPLSN